MTLHAPTHPLSRRRRPRPGRTSSPTGSTQPAASAAAFLYTCTPCQLSSQPMLTRSEAIHLARVHDRLHHAGAPTAAVTDQSVCESCRTEPATTSWSHPRAGAPFALCGPCARVIHTPPAARGETHGRRHRAD